MLNFEWAEKQLFSFCTDCAPVSIKSTGVGNSLQNISSEEKDYISHLPAKA